MTPTETFFASAFLLLYAVNTLIAAWPYLLRVKEDRARAHKPWRL